MLFYCLKIYTTLTFLTYSCYCNFQCFTIWIIPGKIFWEAKKLSPPVYFFFFGNFQSVFCKVCWIAAWEETITMFNTKRGDCNVWEEMPHFSLLSRTMGIADHNSNDYLLLDTKWANLDRWQGDVNARLWSQNYLVTIWD